MVIGSIVSNKGNSAEFRKSLVDLQSEFGQIRDLDTDLVESQDAILKTLEGTFGGAIAKGINSTDLEKVLISIQRVGQRHKGHYGKPEVRDSEGVSWVVELARLGPKEIILGSDLARSLRILEGDQIMVIPPESLLKPKGEAQIYETVTVKALLI